ncbi:hypothetical protein VNO80_17390 [Phaseolus coccineus]|uniref:Methylenetetrahydrofolate reductase n=1 Tax=Phaseolus coccineus TaxID=3886 RepID=A0AAN9MCB1_PHACN
MTGFCKTKIPADIMSALEPIKDNEEAVKFHGVHLGTEITLQHSQRLTSRRLAHPSHHSRTGHQSKNKRDETKTVGDFVRMVDY